ncbi:MAG: D-arabinono-1,4-lactone oxidase [Micromonosporaceae bacterium]
MSAPAPEKPAVALRPTWQNWAGNQRTTARRVARPTGRDELVAAVRDAASDGLPLKPVGAGHSFTSIAATDGVRVVLDAYRRPVEIDRVGRRARVQAGMPLHQLNEWLAEHGLAMGNLGDIDRQTIAGAISTGTHGTGGRLPGLAGFVEELELITGTGEVVRCSATERPDVFHAARVGLGAVGLISEVTLRCEESYGLHADERPMSMQTILNEVDEQVAANDHFEFFWMPYTERALVKRLNRMDPDEPTQPMSGVKSWWERSMVENLGLGAVCRLGRRTPRMIPRLNRVIAGAMSPRVYSDVSYQVLCTPRNVRFYEMEYNVPRAATREALAAIRKVIAKSEVKTNFPVEVRFAAADDIWMSPAYGRDAAYFAVHQFVGMPYQSLFRECEAVLKDLDGRPHWAKLHQLTAPDIADRYPKFSDFLAVRDRLDPDRLFRNDYLDRVLGP